MDLKEIKLILKEHRYTWLITGVGGFIGSNLLETLIELNQKVVGVDNFSTGFKSNIKLALKDSNIDSPEESFTFKEGDISDFDVCKELCEGVDIVLHQAALGSIPRSIDDPINTNNSNINGFLNMLLAAKENGVNRFVYASSSSVYGDHSDLPKVEDKIGNSISPYAATKRVNEIYASVFASTYQYKSIGLRYFNVFGKRQNIKGPYAAVIPKWIMAMLNNEKIEIHGDGLTTRDFCYVKNAIQMNLLSALTTKETALDQVYNVACFQQTSLNDLYTLIKEFIQSNIQGIEILEPVYTDFRKGDVRHSLANIIKAQDLLNYAPAYEVSQGINETIKWYIKEFRK